MSPEQALARRVVIDHRTDVYSLGATLYELLALQPAFAGADRQELLRQIAFEEPKPPRRLSRAIPPELEIIVLKAMEKNPADRYATAKELADDLKHWLEDRPIRARRPSLTQRARKWAQRHRPLVGAMAVCLLVTLVAGGGSAGWVLNDRAGRQDRVREALEAAKPGLREGNPWNPALIAAAERAQAQLGGMLGTDLRQRVEQLQKDMHMLAELEGIRLAQTATRDGHFDHTASTPRYALAFREYGIEVEALGPADASAMVQRSAIREHLVAGLDDWANELARGNEEKRQKASQLLAIARQVDPDGWRSRLRDMVLSRDLRDIDELARATPVGELNAATLNLLGTRVSQRPEAPEWMVELLRRAQRRFPADFWINYNLAFMLQKEAQPTQLEEAIGFFRVAMALRPQSPGAHHSLGVVLLAKGDNDGAIAEYREAIRLKKDYAEAHCNLGQALDDKGDAEGAITELRDALRLRNHASTHYNLGLALGRQGDVDGAIAEYR
jgi:tetratricopeptide (TPR) repeat protein